MTALPERHQTSRASSTYSPVAGTIPIWPSRNRRFSSGGGDAIVLRMDDKHPHDGATYLILRHEDGSFGVEVTIPGANPITISGLDGEAGAEKWIARHKETVAKGRPRRTFTRAKR